MISKSCQYGIRAVVYLAANSDSSKRLNVKQIAAEIDAPEAFTAKLLQQLNKAKVVTSLKGPYGGFYISDSQRQSNILAVVEVIDGLKVFYDCGLGLLYCSETNPCPMHEHYKILRVQMLETFKNTTIQLLAEKYQSGAMLRVIQD
jgi:Rrf2 family iron-sulfur cluster assembly transcriptional regulator